MTSRHTRLRHLLVILALLGLAFLIGMPSNGAYAGLPTNHGTSSKTAHERSLEALKEDSGTRNSSANTNATSVFPSVHPGSPEAWVDKAPMTHPQQRNAVASDGTYIYS